MSKVVRLTVSVADSDVGKMETSSFPVPDEYGDIAGMRGKIHQTIDKLIDSVNAKDWEKMSLMIEKASVKRGKK
jgi:hypothetical protein